MATNVKKITKAQKKVLLEFVEQNPELQTWKTNDKFLQAEYKELWESITITLNSLEGPTKTWMQWRKAWNDQKRGVKIKSSKNKNYTNTTEDGDSLNVDITAPTCSNSMPNEDTVSETALTEKRLHLEKALQDLTDSNLQRQEQEEEYRQKKLLYLDKIVREKERKNDLAEEKLAVLKRKNDLEEKKIVALEKIADSLNSLSSSNYQKM